MELVDLLAAAYPTEAQMLGPARLKHLAAAANAGRPVEEAFEKSAGEAMQFGLTDFIEILEPIAPIIVAILGYLKTRAPEHKRAQGEDILQRFPTNTKEGKWLRSAAGKRLLKFLDEQGR